MERFETEKVRMGRVLHELQPKAASYYYQLAIHAAILNCEWRHTKTYKDTYKAYANAGS